LRALVYPLKHPLRGFVKAPPSKSYTHRALFASLLANGYSRVVNSLVAGDTLATLSTINSFGSVTTLVSTGEYDEVLVRGVGEYVRNPVRIYCRGSGTTLRIATAVAALTEGPTLIYGNESLNRRPVGPLLKALNSLGVRTASINGKPPVIVEGPIKVRDAEVLIDASVSSQFVTALLMIAPVIGLRIKVVGRVKSAPYIDLTLKVLKAFGVSFERVGYREFIVRECRYLPTEFTVPNDYSSASLIMAAAALGGGEVVIEGLDLSDPQGDKEFIKILKEFGAEVRVRGSLVEVVGSESLVGTTVDCSNTPDLVPTIAAVAAHARGVTEVVGADHLVFKESNRLVTLAKNLRALGVEASVTRDGLVIRGGGVRGGVVNSFGDHRVAMSMVVTALRAESPVVIEGIECFTDSYPNFLTDLRSLGALIEVIK